MNIFKRLNIKCSVITKLLVLTMFFCLSSIELLADTDTYSCGAHTVDSCESASNPNCIWNSDSSKCLSCAVEKPQPPTVKKSVAECLNAPGNIYSVAACLAINEHFSLENFCYNADYPSPLVKRFDITFEDRPAGDMDLNDVGIEVALKPLVITNNDGRTIIATAGGVVNSNWIGGIDDVSLDIYPNAIGTIHLNDSDSSESVSGKFQKLILIDGHHNLVDGMNTTNTDEGSDIEVAPFSFSFNFVSNIFNDLNALNSFKDNDSSSITNNYQVIDDYSNYQWIDFFGITNNTFGYVNASAMEISQDKVYSALMDAGTTGLIIPPEAKPLAEVLGISKEPAETIAEVQDKFSQKIKTMNDQAQLYANCTGNCVDNKNNFENKSTGSKKFRMMRAEENNSGETKPKPREVWAISEVLTERISQGGTYNVQAKKIKPKIRQSYHTKVKLEKAIKILKKIKKLTIKLQRFIDLKNKYSTQLEDFSVPNSCDSSSCASGEYCLGGICRMNINTGNALAKFSSLSIINNQLVLNGNDLNGVTHIRMTGPSGFNETFSIESKTATNLIANGLKNISFAVGAAFNLIISDAHGESSFQMTFLMPDETEISCNEVGTGSTSTETNTTNASFSGIDSIASVTDSTATINWTHVAEGSGYQIFSVSGETLTYVSSVNAPTATYNLTGLTPTTTYTYRVRLYDSQGLPDTNTNDVSVTTNVAPDAPTGLTLTTPASGLGYDTTPTITVSGVKSGDTIKLFTDPTCSTEVGSAASAGTTIAITTSTLAVASYTFYANATGDGETSTCSTANVSYTINPCPTGYINVPSMASVGALDDFCVMKFEAKNSGGSPVSTATGAPWVNINQINAKAECQSLGANYDLISNPEWMAIARNVENVASNWTDGVVGSGCLKRGNVGGTYNCTGGDSGYNGSDPESGTGRNALASLRLDNGEVIWDLSGNVWEWTDWTLGGALSTNMIQANKPSQDGTPVASWIELSVVDTFTDHAPEESILPDDPSFNASQGMGKYYAHTSGGAALRGGAWGNGTSGGAFSLYLSNSSGAHVGFRCVFRP